MKVTSVWDMQLLLSELGFDDRFVDRLREEHLMPLARLLYPDWVRGGLDSHRAFVVKYKMEDDVELSYHYDNAEVTLNVCLGAEFEGGDLYFGAMRMVIIIKPCLPIFFQFIDLIIGKKQIKA